METSRTVPSPSEKREHPALKTLLCLWAGFSTQGDNSVPWLPGPRMVSNFAHPRVPPVLQLSLRVLASAAASLIASDSCAPACPFHPPQSDFDFSLARSIVFGKFSSFLPSPLYFSLNTRKRRKRRRLENHTRLAHAAGLFSEQPLSWALCPVLGCLKGFLPRPKLPPSCPWQPRR